MQKLTVEQISKMHFGRKMTIAARLANKILKLEKGEGVMISKKEWSLKTPPNILLHGYKLLQGTEVGVRSYRNNWVILRK